MHKPLKIVSLTALAAGLALTPALAFAQDEDMPDTAAPAPAPTPKAGADTAARLAALPADKQAALKAWPPETQAYYWSLTEQRQKIFWALADRDKVSLSQMPEAQRESAWAQIEARAKPPQA